jgi:predicted HAD superfamily Cof-like phosphohydrolase
VEQFMLLAKHPLPSKPSLPKPSVCALRARLIFEECLELINSLGVNVVTKDGALTLANVNFVNDIPSEEMEFIAKECADVHVVVTGTMSALGIPDVEIQKIVDENNLSKFGPGHSYSPHGKLIKPPDHPKATPLIKAELEKLAK